MNYVWTCTDYDSETATCYAEGWVQVHTFIDYLPTVEQATIVGSAMFFAVAVLMAMSLLSPPRDLDD